MILQKPVPDLVDNGKTISNNNGQAKAFDVFRVFTKGQIIFKILT